MAETDDELAAIYAVTEFPPKYSVHEKPHTANGAHTYWHIESDYIEGHFCIQASGYMAPQVAHLIAAAPALYEALSELVAWFPSKHDDWHTDAPRKAAEAARAALALAEGKQ